MALGQHLTTVASAVYTLRRTVALPRFRREILKFILSIRIMCHTMRCILIVCVALSLLAAGCSVEASNSRPPRKNDVNTMADAYKFLQDLDTYYGDRARVRFGKRGGLMEILRNRELDNNFNLGKSINSGGELVRALDEEEVY